MTDESRRINSVLWYALEKAGDKLKGQKERDALSPGKRIPVSLEVHGRIDGAHIATTIQGALQVSFDGTTSTKIEPPAETVLAIALSYMPKTKRQAMLDGGLVQPVEELLELAEQFLVNNTEVVSKPRRGSVSFEFVQ